MAAKETPGMWARYIIFIVGSVLILVVNMWVMSVFYPQAGKKPRPAADKNVAAAPKQTEKEDAAKDQKDEAAKPEALPEAKEQEPAEVAKAAEAEAEAEAEREVPPQWVTLGSADPNAPYRMLVTLTNRGAAVERVELNGERFRDLENNSGYLGYVAMEPVPSKDGCLVQMVGDGTPGAQAGLKPGDRITALDSATISSFFDFKKQLAKTKPKQTITLTVQRDGQELKLPVKLARHPLEVIRPEGTDPLSFLFTLHQLDDQNLGAKQEKDVEREKEHLAKEVGGFRPRPTIDQELPGIDLRSGTWTVEHSSPTEAVFSRKLPKWGLEVTKTYRLAEVPKTNQKDSAHPAYHLEFDVSIRNIGQQAHKVSYQLDGPTGLPVEGYWYASKVSHTWSASGLRDIAVSLEDTGFKMISAPQIAHDDLGAVWKDPAVKFVGVDAQYFSSVLIPQQKSGETWFAEGQPLRVGPVEVAWPSKTDTSFRLISKTEELEPGKEITHSYKVFAGPKKPALLAKYGLGDLVYYGWFSWVAVPMLWILHTFYAIFGNYGLAIILLTVVVRSAMFPLSRKQALSAQKMQAIQPELKKLAEKHKNNPEQRMKAQQELFRKHNYNPAGGCLPVFLQLPIFVGLYNTLRVDVELRQAPLISSIVPWCTNLAAPDMLFNWTSFMPTFITSGQGIFGLGPYFNILPLVTVVLFLWQQKKMMPPPADEQAAMQQNVMKFMMIFMGLMFFKVASGLCVYFIATSIWSIAERKFLPKTTTASPPSSTDSGSQGRFGQRAKSNGDTGPDRKKRRDKKN